MNRLFFMTPILLGVIAIVWIGISFIGSNVLALSVTAIIGAAYALGIMELVQFRRATLTLSTALDSIPDKLLRLGDWLDSIHPSLQNSVRLRIEGERIGLPGPTLTPYLVSLLVMLGMLGTFLGMVATLNGAVFALEGTPDLQTIRAGLAAPIKGLGLAFGTSVAGVAASAMLGLVSTLSRRERLLTAQRLDTKVATRLRPFSLAYQRQETYKAIQLQAHSLPNVAEKLKEMTLQMEKMSNHINERLVNNQERFHASVQGVFTELAQSVEKSLTVSLTEAGRLAGESMKPIVEGAMVTVVHEAQATQATLVSVVQSALKQSGEQTLLQQKNICSTLEATARNIADNAQSSAQRIHSDLNRFLEASDALVQARRESEVAWLSEHGARMDRIATVLGGELIGLLREEISKNIQRDNVLLDDRTRMMERLDLLLSSFSKTSADQTAAIEMLVTSSTDKLNSVSTVFASNVEVETRKLADMTAQVTGSAVEVSSSSEAFGFAVQRFSASNDKLIESLTRVEIAMDKSATRSDEQLGYYVAQAREIIELSMMSQKEIFEELRQLPAQSPRVEAGAKP